MLDLNTRHDKRGVKCVTVCSMLFKFRQVVFTMAYVVGQWLQKEGPGFDSQSFQKEVCMFSLCSSIHSPKTCKFRLNGDSKLQLSVSERV